MSLDAVAEGEEERSMEMTEGQEMKTEVRHSVFFDLLADFFRVFRGQVRIGPPGAFALATSAGWPHE
jgi:hypothetical protein